MINTKNTASLFLVVFALHIFSISAVGEASGFRSLSASLDNFKYSEYYIFREQAVDINLLDLTKVASLFPLPVEKYNREKHFGTWIKPVKDSCLNTRGHVLLRESRIDMSNQQGCYVKQGEWYDPYTDHVLVDTSAVQIDHLVPLKNAYMTGAHEWDNTKRCLYANYMGFKWHLIPVTGFENQDKGDKNPSEYLPPNLSYRCEYLKNWLTVKLIWKLKLTPPEFETIRSEVESHNCDPAQFIVKKADLQFQKSYIVQNKNLCRSNSSARPLAGSMN